MKFAMLSFDLEEFPYPEESHQKAEKQELFDISARGLDLLLRRFKPKSTFFTTMEFAQKYPATISRLVKDGHEIGLHGISHVPQTDYPALGNARKFLSEEYHTEVIGFRPPRFSYADPKKLKQAGFRYASLTHPRLFSKHREKGISNIKGLVEIPISVTPTLRLPFSWVWFRNAGFSYAKFCSRQVLKKMDYLLLYFHPWEFTDLKKTRFQIPWYIKRNTGKYMLNMLLEYSKWLQNSGVVLCPISQFLKEYL